MKVHVTLSITGKVQGVFFRASAREKASSLNINGYARNEKDGSVLVEAEGEENVILNFIEWCKDGPRMAKVIDVNVEYGVVKNFKDFQSVNF
ncbi:MAG: acylphosphatase [Flammeovirgaceae bacterium]|nr:acylphosphatase [Flammeovirgaceae bacterium]